MSEEDDIESINISEDPLQAAIQALDDEYFEAHPGDDYYIRPAAKEELARAGYPDYEGLMLIYRISGGLRVRRPVADRDSAVRFMVEFERYLEQELD